MRRLFGTFGVRGIVGRDMTPRVAFDLGLALATYLGNSGKVAVGRDNRTSSEMLEHAVSSGLTAGGCDVLSLGLVPTPVLSFGTRHFSCDAGVMITASHNPPEYNGVKFWCRDGAGFSRDMERDVEKILDEGGKLVRWDEVGSISTADAIEPYVHAILRRVGRVKKEWKVVVDCANGVGALVTPRLLREMGCKVVTLNGQLDGTFPGRKLEPVPENLTELSETVLACRADLGIAHDGDADRTIAVNERGEVMMGDRVFAIAALHHLSGKKDARIITTVATSSVMDDVARMLGASIVRTRVGEPEIIGEYRKAGGGVGGEENGGVFFFDWSMCREGIHTALTFVEALDRSGGPVSALDAKLPRYYQVKRRVECPEERKAKVLESLPGRFSGQKLDLTDGVKVIFEDGWLLVRPSGTEPIFRCFAEARTKERAEELAAAGMRELQSLISGP
ncbi:MAG: phosphoglucosamine mutase [Candidatus Hadarchaeales archaeon]